MTSNPKSTCQALDFTLFENLFPILMSLWAHSDPQSRLTLGYPNLKFVFGSQFLFFIVNFEPCLNQ